MSRRKIQTPRAPTFIDPLAKSPGQALPLGAGFPKGDCEAMMVIAERTGGRTFCNANDVAGAIHSAIDDSRMTYVLGYYPDHGLWNGKFREIRITVNRPGVDVRYRHGYFAAPEAAPTLVARKALLQEVLDSPIDSTTIGMTVNATIAGSRGEQTVKLRIQFDTQSFVLAREGDHWNARLDFMVAQSDDKGKVLKAEVRTSAIRVTEAGRAAWDKYGFDFHSDTPVLPGASRIRVVECDEQSGATGSVTIPIASLVPDSH